MKKQKIRVMLVDDHTIVRKGLRLILELHDRIEVCGEAASLKETIEMITVGRPDVILLDFKLPDGDGIEGCKKIRKQFPEIKILILTAYSQDHIVMEAIRAGANGYLLKNIKSDELIKSVFNVFENESVLDPSVTEVIFKQLHTRNHPTEQQLSPRETDILNMISKGSTNKEIAESLYISEKTVRNYISNLFKKINVHNRTKAARYWLMKNS
ncbi:response regulator [Niallia sp. Krafla_26]|uniref:response regulator n=1 Tax=Niallia sp. Krafla_26 TaxID=3064703 RepID=UPI003D169635